MDVPRNVSSPALVGDNDSTTMTLPIDSGSRGGAFFTIKNDLVHGWGLDMKLGYCAQEHALAVEHLAPSLAALRMELCPGYMSDGNFWKIYFVLVHPRLSKIDAAILSTPQVS
ncbi:hypothetical protein glysoja_048816 [Glycine soja]|uniref:BSD domain-containing protein n=1 Tax=Glycine soja TaxID=3848 RepID=A0A0B2QHJ2_GLYSO|nr:hypothetical protein glysoja_048816 [Glycine soja]